jgi:hypothetical protein
MAAEKKMVTVLGDHYPDELAKVINPIYHHSTIRAFVNASWRDGGIYGESPRVHIPARFAEDFRHQGYEVAEMTEGCRTV